ncbi:mechanosensitive ion channel family protein [Parvularcula sp. LCG005]|uniref:mechanosensitive ion channel family protein n=1 Tax=Parvularcula sp. LCG005 TaxID=3078805 RepID=UPI0029438E04|nr:mechanosensitive ion channel family protein [Parvularcula sp. LCG005]WOI52323.1 mechanosensitive ion channel family protein [Parvularcula sp. LCG005]
MISRESAQAAFWDDIDFRGLAETKMEQLRNWIDWLMTDGADWTIWCVAGIAVFIGLRFLRAMLSGMFHTSKKDERAVRNLISRLLSATTSLFLLLLSFSVTAPFAIELTELHAEILQKSMMVAFVLQGALWVRVIADAFLNGIVERNSADASTLASAKSLLTLFLNIAIFAIALILIIENLGGNAAGLIAGLGVGGIAIGLAAQSVFQDLFSSLAIVLDKPFVKGDFIAFNGNLGTIEKIGMKTTRLRTLSGEQLSVTNSNLLDSDIRNYKRMEERRIVFSVGVTYQAPRSTLEVIPGRIRQIIEAKEMCRFDRSHLASYADSAITFETVYYVLSKEYGDYMDVQQEIYLEIHALFEELDAEFAYPTRTLFIENPVALQPQKPQSE